MLTLSRGRTEKLDKCGLGRSGRCKEFGCERVRGLGRGSSPCPQHPSVQTFQRPTLVGEEEQGGDLGEWVWLRRRNCWPGWPGCQDPGNPESRAPGPVWACFTGGGAHNWGIWTEAWRGLAPSG